MINILVVEDDMKLNQIVCKYLNNNNYQAKGCMNPQEAYDLLFSSRFDLIISDIMMPELTVLSSLKLFGNKTKPSRFYL